MLVDKISIIVPVYNVAEYLPQCIDSLLGQSYQNIEIICVNDGSTDNSLSILEKYAENSKQVYVLNQDNQGLSGARNTGVAFATGDYLMFVDSDDWVDLNICEILLSAAIKYGADCVMCSYCKDYGSRVIENHIFNENVVWDEDETKQKFYRRLFGPIGKETKYPHNVDIIVSACMQLFRTDICKDVLFIDTKKVGTEDCLYQMMIYKKCKCFVYVDKPLYHYRKTNETSLTTKYNPYLFDRWQNMYDLMEEIIKHENYPPVYWDALNNRIAFALIGLGLNEVSADISLMDKSKRIKYIVSRNRYKSALEKLDLQYMIFPWKVFFYMLKHRVSLPIIVMLQLIQIMRGR